MVSSFLDGPGKAAPCNLARNPARSAEDSQCRLVLCHLILYACLAYCLSIALWQQAFEGLVLWRAELEPTVAGPQLGLSPGQCAIVISARILAKCVSSRLTLDIVN